MKLNKSIIIPLLVLLFAGFGFEQLGLPYVSFGSGRWSDSVGTNVSNRSSRINGNLNVTGNYYKNGVLFTGGGSAISGSDESAGILATVTGVDFVGNTFTATGDTNTGLLTLTSTMDTNNYYSRHRLDTSDIALLSQSADFAGDVTAAQFQTTGGIVGDELTINNSSNLSGLVTVASGIQLSDATKVIVNSGNDILYKVTIGGAHKFQTSSGTTLANIDSATGFSSATWAQLGPSAPVEAVKLVRFKVGAPNSTTTAAHGLDHNTIIGWTCTIRDDTTNTQVNPQSWYSPWVFYAKIESLNVSVVIPASPSGNSVANDSALFRIVYRK